jgi:DNA-binding MarR family transcriptional regulator
MEEVRRAFAQLMAAERRLRARQQHGSGQLPYAHVRALSLLDAEGPATAGRLAEETELRPASVTAMLDHLEAEGIVRRRRSDEDRRCVLVELTDDGREVLATKRERWRRFGEDALADVPAPELAAAVRVMRSLAEGIDTLDAGR